MKETIVDRVIAAIADKDVDAFVACYTEDATIEDGHDHVIARGHDELRERYQPMFEQYPDIEIRTGWRTTVGDFVVEEETVSGRGPEEERHVAVYLIRDGKIARERLVG
ncbi:MAG TPA: nuclear transport factor 2 family protein [Gaiellaceae bacterium]